MKRRVRIFLQLMAVLLSIGISVDAQPTVVTQIPGESENFESIGGLVYFTVGTALWRTDGTAAGTFELKTGFSGFSTFTAFDGKLIFRSGKTPQVDRVAWNELWASDGTPSGTVLVKRSADYDVNIARATDTYLFFSASDIATGRELYRTDGTSAGTALVKDLFPGTGNGFGSVLTAAPLGNELLFAGNDGSSGTELWKSDGTSAGTVMIRDINPGAGNGMDGGVFAFNNIFYFRGNNGESGWEPWVTDGSAAGTFMLKEIVAGSGGVGGIRYEIENNGSVYFLVWPGASDPSFAPDLWISSGTTASTLKLRTLGYPDDMDEFYAFVIYQDNVYFLQRHANFSHILWKSDGTPEGTNTFFSLDDTWNDGITFFDVVKDHLLFTGISQGYPFPLHRHNGIETEIFYRFKSGGFTGADRNVTAPHIEKSGDLAFFADHEGSVNDGGQPSSEEDYFQLYQTDGVTTQSMRSLYGVTITGVKEISDFNGKLIFTTHDDYYIPGEDFQKLWIYDPSASPSTGAGKLSVETWNGISGTHVSLIPVDSPPSSTSEITTFETPKNIGDNYGSRVSGYIIPPGTGNYTFWIASDDRSELWLSTDDNPANKKRIAYVAGWTTSRQWDKYPAQTSAPVSLVGGRKYYVEALLKEATGADHLAVGWQLPNGTLERPIPSDRLMLLQNEDPVVEFTSPENNFTFTAPGTVDVTMTASDSDGRIFKIDVYQLNLSTNELNNIGPVTIEPYWFRWGNNTGGSYALIAKAIDNSGGSATDTLFITVEPPPCASIGKIRVETWTGVSGTHISSIPLNSPPSSVSDLTSFETPANIGDNYGSRIRGYICVPTTGNYTFWIASDDRSELWLSTDADPTKKERIAYVSGWTAPREWEKYATQKSVAVSLIAGRRYYVEALLKEGTGRDHLAVGWQLPGGALERPIAGSRLIPFETPEPGRGVIEAEVWTGISGTNISSIPFDSPPNSVSEITIFKTAENIGDNYGSRVRGYLHPPRSGDYIFWIASDDRSELWLSTDSNPDNKVRIAHVSGWTDPGQWEKYATQRSVPVSLIGGRKYYIEALLKEGSGRDHLAVGWQVPFGPLERPIPGSRLSKFEMSSSAMALTGMETTEDQTIHSQINIYPNPASSADVELRVSGYENISEHTETKIEIINMTGEIVYAEKISCGGGCGSYLMKMNKQLVPGIYVVNMQTNGVRTAKRLLVK